MSQQSQILHTLAVIGVGLIGGSLAGALKKRGAVGTVVGCGRSEENLEIALTRGLIDQYTTDLGQAQSATKDIGIGVALRQDTRG